MRILLTGAAGFIGSHTARALLEAGHQVLGVDNFDPFYDRSIKEAGLAPLRERKGFEFAERDIRDSEKMDQLAGATDLIIHLAARAGVRPSIEQPELYASINVLGTTNLLEAARKAGHRQFVFGSSSSVYGDSSPVPFNEDFPAVNPISPYAATKRSGELACEVYSHLYRMRIASLRFFTVYGPRQRPDLAIHKFSRLMWEGKAIQRYGDGTTERDYTHIDDIVQGILGALTWCGEPDPAHEIFNLGESETVPLSVLIDLISQSLGVEPRIEELPDQPGDVRRTCADISKARDILGYQPAIKIEAGIPLFVKWFKGAYAGK